MTPERLLGTTALFSNTLFVTPAQVLGDDEE
jgi:hypothetical protein